MLSASYQLANTTRFMRRQSRNLNISHVWIKECKVGSTYFIIAEDKKKQHKKTLLNIMTIFLFWPMTTSAFCSQSGKVRPLKTMSMSNFFSF